MVAAYLAAVGHAVVPTPPTPFLGPMRFGLVLQVRGFGLYKVEIREAPKPKTPKPLNP